ncbi:uncharacterized protein LOC111369139 [Olea europaea var. sylvestris]|uniref:uncharacterized protein LOC111369139 n=1 Tax=Olea europaea var. sylvestris TaxID=158386 RepID=UPI000C1CD6F8|nr:uncharacterized protein LOC111369139 [Olea europaea var. sylvestris]
MVDATAGHKLLSFMDAYFEYNQIPMYGADQEHTSFVTDRGLYYYRVMPFGFKNAGATYQRLVNSMFSQQIEKIMEVCVDDMLIKSINAKDHCQHLTEMFDILRKYGMKLNPRKCAFGVSSGRFLGNIVNNRGIKANTEKIQAVIQMKPPTKPRERLKLRPYFLEHPIEVLTNSPLRQTLQRPDTSGRMVKWAVELEQFDIKYTPRSSIKSQAVVDFVSELCNVLIEELQKETPWKLYVDGSSTRERSGVGVVLISPEHRIFCEALPFDFKASNNEAEYEALIIRARMALGLGISDLIIHSDSQLVVN